MLINSGKCSFFSHYIFALLFAALCLAAIIFGYHQYNFDKYAFQVERASLDLLGFIEYDGKFYVEDEYISNTNKFVTNAGWLGSSEGLSYIWDVNENKVVWSLDEQLRNNTIYPPNLMEKLAGLAYSSDDSGFEKQRNFSPVNAVAVEVPFANGKGVYEYMTAVQLFDVKVEEGSGSKPKKYLLVTAKSMQTSNDDLSTLIRISVIVLIAFSLLLGFGWLVFRFFTKVKMVKHADVVQGELS